MAITVSTNTNLSQLTTMTSGMPITIRDGATLTIDTDTRFGPHPVELGNITVDENTGGHIVVDGTRALWLNLSGSSGTVPTVMSGPETFDVTNQTTGVLGGQYLGSWLSVGSNIRTAGQTHTNHVKLRGFNGTIAPGHVLRFSNGSTVTVSAVQRSWLMISGNTQTSWSAGASGSITFNGDFFNIGITNGMGGQQFQAPFGTILAIQIETAPNSNIYEWWNAVGNRKSHANRFAADLRGRVFQSTLNGLITIARRDIFNGFLPPPGCRVRIPNLMMNGFIGHSPNLPPSSGNISIGINTNTVRVNGVNNLALRPGLHREIRNSTFIQYHSNILSETLTIDSCASGVCAGAASANWMLPLSIVDSVSEQTKTVSNCAFYRFGDGGTEGAAANYSAVIFTNCNNFIVNNLRVTSSSSLTAATLNRSNAGARILQINNSRNFTLNNTSIIGGCTSINASQNINFNGINYADCVENRTTNNINPIFAFDIVGASSNCSFLNFRNFENILGVHPNLGIFNLGNSNTCRIENIGTITNPYNGAAAVLLPADSMQNVINLGSSFSASLRNIFTNNINVSLFSGITTIASNTSVFTMHGDIVDNLNLVPANGILRGLRSNINPATIPLNSNTLWMDNFDSDTTGQIIFLASFFTPVAANQIFIRSGNPVISNSGYSLWTVGDSIEAVMPYRALGHMGLNSITFFGTNELNHLIEFSTNNGATWAVATPANLTAVGAIDPAVGIDLRLRVTCVTGDRTNVLRSIRINTTSTVEAQAIQYPLPGIPIVLQGVLPGSEVRLFRGRNPETMVEIDGTENTPVGASYTVEHSEPAGTEGTVVIHRLGMRIVSIPIVFSATPTTIPIQQITDRVFENL